MMYLKKKRQWQIKEGGGMVDMEMLGVEALSIKLLRYKT